MKFEDFKLDEKGLIPAIVQDEKTNEVLMMAYMNKEAFEKTMETKKAHYWSRSRGKLWLKGETSGHFQHVKAIQIDCDQDTLILKVEQVEAACHTGNYSCFYREIVQTEGSIVLQEMSRDNTAAEEKSKILQELYGIIEDRKIHPKEGSYTNYLFEKGVDKILKKVGEETAEVIIAAKNRSHGEVKYEVSDLIYHLFVLLVEQGVKLEDIFDELKERR